jgi:hypothetical protein
MSTPQAGEFEPGRVYRCIGEVMVWEVDRVASNGPSSSWERPLQPGAIFRVDSFFGGDAEITILQGKPPPHDPDDVSTGDYHTRLNSVGQCEIIDYPTEN